MFLAPVITALLFLGPFLASPILDLIGGVLFPQAESTTATTGDTTTTTTAVPTTTTTTEVPTTTTTTAAESTTTTDGETASTTTGASTESTTTTVRCGGLFGGGLLGC